MGILSGGIRLITASRVGISICLKLEFYQSFQIGIFLLDAGNRTLLVSYQIIYGYMKKIADLYEVVDIGVYLTRFPLSHSLSGYIQLFCKLLLCDSFILPNQL